MRTRQPGCAPFYPKIQFACTDHPITVWAGAILLRLYCELIGLRAVLAPVLAPFATHSPNQIPALDVLLTLMLWAGVGGRA